MHHATGVIGRGCHIRSWIRRGGERESPQVGQRHREKLRQDEIHAGLQCRRKTWTLSSCLLDSQAGRWEWGKFFSPTGFSFIK